MFKKLFNKQNKEQEDHAIEAVKNGLPKPPTGFWGTLNPERLEWWLKIFGLTGTSMNWKDWKDSKQVVNFLNEPTINGVPLSGRKATFIKDGVKRSITLETVIIEERIPENEKAIYTLPEGSTILNIENLINTSETDYKFKTTELNGEIKLINQNGKAVGEPVRITLIYYKKNEK